jgi:cytochrome c
MNATSVLIFGPSVGKRHMKKALSFALVLGLVAGLSAQEEKKDDAAAKGKEIFEEQCGVCHAADSDEKKVGPALKGLFKREKMKNGTAITEESVMKLIVEGGNGMPAYDDDTLSKEQKAQVLAYLKTL